MRAARIIHKCTIELKISEGGIVLIDFQLILLTKSIKLYGSPGDGGGNMWPLYARCHNQKVKTSFAALTLLDPGGGGFHPFF